MTSGDQGGASGTPPAAEATARKKEGWRGIAITAVLCGLFLWWWFQPEPTHSQALRDPNYWVELARRERGGQTPTPEMAFEIAMIAEVLRARGDRDGAEKLEGEWLPPAWRNDEGGPPSFPAPSDPPFDAIGARLDEASAAVDQLEIERGQVVLRDAVANASSLAEPARTTALWWVASRQARCGFAVDAATTRSPMGDGAAPALPAWVLAAMLQAEIVHPVVSRISGHALPEADAVKIGRLWRSVVRDRASQAENGLIARDGPDANPTRGGGDASVSSRSLIRQAVDDDDLRRADDLARQATRGAERVRAFLVIARRLAWRPPGVTGQPASSRG